jgi:hypothetical protein
MFSAKFMPRSRSLRRTCEWATESCVTGLRPGYVPVFVTSYVAALIDSLQTSQDFLRGGSLSCVCRGDDCVHSIDSIEKSELKSYALSPFPMTLMVLATTCLVACAFYI